MKHTPGRVLRSRMRWVSALHNIAFLVTFVALVVVAVLVMKERQRTAVTAFTIERAREATKGKGIGRITLDKEQKEKRDAR